MYDKFIDVEERFVEVEKRLSDPEIVQNREAYELLSREHADLSKMVSVFRAYKLINAELDGALDLLKDGDPEIKTLAKTEIDQLSAEKDRLDNELKQLLIPKDPNAEKNVIVEIRAGIGGEEAGLFAGDLFRMYSRYAENKGWKVEVLNHHPTGVGGLKEVMAMIHGKGAYSRLKFESGTHRVQRVPATETQGRVHTSAVTVAVLPEAEEVEVDIDPSEVKVDVYRSTGPGGQSVNTTDSAVRVTHLPTGLVVTCQDEKSQHKNKARALKVLRARLLDKMAQEQNAKRSEERKSQIGSGERSERIRTYNFSQGRVTDHRVGLTLYKLESILQGDIDKFIDELTTHFHAQAIKDGEPVRSQNVSMEHP